MARLYLFYVIIASLQATGLLQEERESDDILNQRVARKVVPEVGNRSKTHSITPSSTTVRQERELSYCGNDFSTITHMKNFVDKTMFIKDFFVNYNFINRKGKEMAVAVFTGPPRFGKSTLLNMMQQFVQIPLNEDKTPMTDLKNSPNYHLFCNETRKLKITSEKDIINRHCGKYVVINIDFYLAAPVIDINFYFRQIMRDTYNDYLWLYNQYKVAQKNNILDGNELADFEFFNKIITMKANVDEVNNALSILRDMLYRHFGEKQRIFILVDEYDSPGIDTITRNRPFKPEYVQGRVNILLHNALKGSGSYKVAFAYITGINQVSLNDGPSKMNHADVYGFLLPYSTNFHHEYFGFTENEVNKLLTHLGYTNDVQKKVKENFNGYYSPSRKIHIYCLYSIIQFTKHNNLKTYRWAGSGLGKFLLKPLRNCEIRLTFLLLLSTDVLDFESGVHIPHMIDMFNMEDLDNMKQSLNLSQPESGNYYGLFYKYMYDLGYITHAETSGNYRIPNVEIRNFCLNQMKSYYDEVKHVDMALLGDIMFNILQLKTVDEKYLSDCELQLTGEFQKIRSTERTELTELPENIQPNEFEYYALLYVASVHGMGFEFVKAISKFDKHGRATSSTKKDGKSGMMLWDPISKNCVLVVEIKSCLPKMTEKNWKVDVVMDQAQQYEIPEPHKNMEIKCLAIYMDSHESVQMKFEPKCKTTIQAQ